MFAYYQSTTATLQSAGPKLPTFFQSAELSSVKLAPVHVGMDVGKPRLLLRL
jgi:hypothetical protein